MVDPLADLPDHAGDVAALDPRERYGTPPPGEGVGTTGEAVGALPGPEVGVVHRGRADLDEDLAAARDGLLDLAYLEGFGTAERRQDRCLHHANSFTGL
jgi:hypothetical protein